MKQVIHSVALCWLLCGVMLAQAPAPAAKGPAAQLPSLGDQLPDDPDAITVPDERPLSGGRTLTLGEAGGARSFLVPTLSFAQTVDTSNAAGSRMTQAISTLGGGLEIQHRSRRSATSLRYSGGGTFHYGDDTLLYGAGDRAHYHRLAFENSFEVGRWNITMADDFEFSPESLFGGGSGIDIAGVGGNFSGLNPSFVENQTILNGQSNRVTNTALGELQYNFSPRSSWTVTGSYGLLHHVDEGFINNRQITASTGYNRELTRRDTVALSYGLTRVEFDDVATNLMAHRAQMSYARRVTGRLTFSVQGGPQFITLEQPGADFTSTTWTAGTDLTYRYKHTTVLAAYSRNVTGGAGVMLGSNADVVSGSIAHGLTQWWTVHMGGGYSRNSEIQQDRRINSTYGDVGLRRIIGRYSGLGFSYRFQRQDEGLVCGPIGCVGDPQRHTFGMQFDWSFRPVRIR